MNGTVRVLCKTGLIFSCFNGPNNPTCGGFGRVCAIPESTMHSLRCTVPWRSIGQVSFVEWEAPLDSTLSCDVTKRDIMGQEGTPGD